MNDFSHSLGPLAVVRLRSTLTLFVRSDLGYYTTSPGASPPGTNSLTTQPETPVRGPDWMRTFMLVKPPRPNRLTFFLLYLNVTSVSWSSWSIPGLAQRLASSNQDEKLLREHVLAARRKSTLPPCSLTIGTTQVRSALARKMHSSNRFRRLTCSRTIPVIFYCVGARDRSAVKTFSIRANRPFRS